MITVQRFEVNKPSSAADRNIEPILIDSQLDVQSAETRWVLLTRNTAVLESSFVSQSKRDWPIGFDTVRWADDFGNIVGLLDWSADVDWEKIKSSQAKPNDVSKN